MEGEGMMSLYSPTHHVPTVRGQAMTHIHDKSHAYSTKKTKKGCLRNGEERAEDLGRESAACVSKPDASDVGQEAVFDEQEPDGIERRHVDV